MIPWLENPHETPQQRSEGVALIGAIAWEIPSFRPEFTDELLTFSGDVQPHLALAAYERKAESLLASDPEAVIALLEMLEEAAGRELPTVNAMIEVSFVGHLPYPNEDAAELRDLLGPRLQAMLKHGLASS